jgi:hypothetical protein
MKKIGSHEQGQVIILLAVGLITLLGFAGLAIDGGRVYSERRFIQGVADTSSLTGALYIAQNIDMTDKVALIAQAEAVSEGRAEHEGFVSPQADTSITEDSSYYYVETRINTIVPATIAKVVYNNDFGVAASSIARVKKFSVFAMGQAMFSINPTICGALEFNGTASTTILSTGIYSNSNCQNQADGPQNAITFGGAGTAEIQSGVYTPGGVYTQNPDNINWGEIDTDAAQIDFDKIEPPDCSGLDPKSVGGNTTLEPGIYNGLSFSGNKDWVLEPGLYCLDGDLSMVNGTLNGDGVTIYMRGNSKVNINGGEIHLFAPPPSNPADAWGDGTWNGMLFFYSYTSDRKLYINGNVDSEYTGTIYNYGGECILNGSGESSSFNVQVVCDTITVSGNAEIVFDYNPDEQYIPPIKIDLFK